MTGRPTDLVCDVLQREPLAEATEKHLAREIDPGARNGWGRLSQGHDPREERDDGLSDLEWIAGGVAVSRKATHESTSQDRGLSTEPPHGPAAATEMARAARPPSRERIGGDA